MPETKAIRSVADQIYDALWLCVSPKKNALDSERLELHEDVRRIIRQRNLAKLIEFLELIGKGPNTAEGKRIIGIATNELGFY